MVIRHHEEDDAGLIGAALTRRGFELSTVMINATTPVPRELLADLVVILGSNESVYDTRVRAHWLDDEISALRRVDESGTPIFGICFGAQVLCSMFGGSVERARSEEIGWTTIDVTPNSGLSLGPWFEYHHDHCILPKEAEIWATTDVCVQAFILGRHVGVQFHPELDAEQLGRWFDSENGAPRAHSPRQRELLAETAELETAASQRADELVDLVLKHASLT